MCLLCPQKPGLCARQVTEDHLSICFIFILFDVSLDIIKTLTRANILSGVHKKSECETHNLFYT